jgi:hypothetical protein
LGGIAPPPPPPLELGNLHQHVQGPLVPCGLRAHKIYGPALYGMKTSKSLDFFEKIILL